MIVIIEWNGSILCSRFLMLKVQIACSTKYSTVKNSHYNITDHGTSCPSTLPKNLSQLGSVLVTHNPSFGILHLTELFCLTDELTDWVMPPVKHQCRRLGLDFFTEWCYILKCAFSSIVVHTILDVLLCVPALLAENARHLFASAIQPYFPSY